MDIHEGNKMIAEFLGYETDELAEEDEPIRYFVNDQLICTADSVDYWETSENDWTSWCYPEDMKFHTSWDWLMPVCHKIAKINATEIEKNDVLSMPQWEFGSIGLESSIEVVYKAAVKFIKWYNTQNQ